MAKGMIDSGCVGCVEWLNSRLEPVWLSLVDKVGDGDENGRVEPFGLPIPVDGVDGCPIIGWPLLKLISVLSDSLKLFLLHFALAFWNHTFNPKYNLI